MTSKFSIRFLIGTLTVFAIASYALRPQLLSVWDWYRGECYRHATSLPAGFRLIDLHLNLTRSYKMINVGDYIDVFVRAENADSRLILDNVEVFGVGWPNENRVTDRWLITAMGPEESI